MTVAFRVAHHCNVRPTWGTPTPQHAQEAVSLLAVPAASAPRHPWWRSPRATCPPPASAAGRRRRRRPAGAGWTQIGCFPCCQAAPPPGHWGRSPAGWSDLREGLGAQQATGLSQHRGRSPGRTLRVARVPAAPCRQRYRRCQRAGLRGLCRNTLKLAVAGQVRRCASGTHWDPPTHPPTHPPTSCHRREHLGLFGWREAGSRQRLALGQALLQPLWAHECGWACWAGRGACLALLLLRLRRLRLRRRRRRRRWGRAQLQRQAGHPLVSHHHMRDVSSFRILQSSSDDIERAGEVYGRAEQWVARNAALSTAVLSATGGEPHHLCEGSATALHRCSPDLHARATEWDSGSGHKHLAWSGQDGEHRSPVDARAAQHLASRRAFGGGGRADQTATCWHGPPSWPTSPPGRRRLPPQAEAREAVPAPRCAASWLALGRSPAAAYVRQRCWGGWKGRLNTTATKGGTGREALWACSLGAQRGCCRPAATARLPSRRPRSACRCVRAPALPPDQRCISIQLQKQVRCLGLRVAPVG